MLPHSLALLIGLAAGAWVVGWVGRGSVCRSLPHGPELDPPRRPVSRVSRLLPQAKELEFIIEP